MLFKALQYITCQDIEYAPGAIIPGATSFPNLKEMIEWRYIGYATPEEIKAYEAEQQRLEKLAKKKEKQDANTNNQAETDEVKTTEEQSEVVEQVTQEEPPK